jgi:hypothetical protein
VAPPSRAGSTLTRSYDRYSVRPRAFGTIPRARRCGGFSYGDALGAGEGWAVDPVQQFGAREFAAFAQRDVRWACAWLPYCRR